MGNPWDNDPIVSSPGPIYGAPRRPAPQTPAQSQQDQLQVAHLGQQIEAQPLQNESTRTNIEQNRSSMQNQRFNQNQGLRQEYNALPLTKNYQTVVQKMGSALNAPAGPQGDLDVLYAFATVMDPNSVVRESEQDMAKQTASLYQQLQQKYRSYLEGNGLPPEVRQGLIETMRHNTAVINNSYNQQRAQYEDLAKRNGFDPTEIVGPHLGSTMQPLESQYIEAHGGTPRDPNAPGIEQAPTAPTVTEQGFGIQPSGSTPTKSGEDFRNELFSAMKSGQIKSPADVKAFQAQYNQSHGTGWSVNLESPDTRKALVAARRGKAFNIETPLPDISDVRGGKNTGAQDMVSAVARGLPDTLTSGTIDKIVAGSDTLFKGGPMDYNLQRQYAITDYDQRNHPLARMGGQALGGSLLPLGETNSLLSLAAKGGAYGMAYGVGSSRSLSDVPGNAALGLSVGAGLPLAVGGAARGISALRGGPKEIPPLVDPQTGHLNEPLEQAGPAARVGAARDFGIDLPMGSAGDRTAAIVERKLDVRPASAGRMNDARRVVEGQVQSAADTVAGQFGSARTLNEGGSELQRGAQERIERGKAIIGKAYDAIPISDGSPTSLANTRGALNELSSQFDSNPALAAAVRSAKIEQYAKALSAGDLSWRDLKAFRTRIGEAIGERRFNDDSATSDLRALYGALSQDMRDTASLAGSGALRAFERANSLNRQNEQVIQGALTRILGKDGNLAPEKAASAVQAMTQGGKSTGDLKALAQVRAATVKSGAWDEIAGTLIRIGGQPANSPGRGFDPGTFVRWYSDMAEPARAMLFKPELRASLNKFVMVNQRLANSNALRNTSNTAMASPTGTFGFPSAVALLFTGHPVAAAGLAVGTGLKAAGEYGMAGLWTNPKFVQWATGYARATATGNENAVRSQVGRLSKLAATNPELRTPIENLLKHVANDNLVRPIAASPDSSDGNQNKQ